MRHVLAQEAAAKSATPVGLGEDQGDGDADRPSSRGSTEPLHSLMHRFEGLCKNPLRHPRVRMRLLLATVFPLCYGTCMGYRSPAGHEFRETLRDRHGKTTAVCGFFCASAQAWRPSRLSLISGGSCHGAGYREVV